AGHLEVMEHSLADVTTTDHSPAPASVPLHRTMTLVSGFRVRYAGATWAISGRENDGVTPRSDAIASPPCVLSS
ncbi:MAG: hypothetical protein ACRENX_07635, partial [Candidatus Dormibacteria bacterium]